MRSPKEPLKSKSSHITQQLNLTLENLLNEGEPPDRICHDCPICLGHSAEGWVLEPTIGHAVGRGMGPWFRTCRYPMRWHLVLTEVASHSISVKWCLLYDNHLKKWLHTICSWKRCFYYAIQVFHFGSHLMNFLWKFKKNSFSLLLKALFLFQKREMNMCPDWGEPTSI